MSEKDMNKDEIQKEETKETEEVVENESEEILVEETFVSGEEIKEEPKKNKKGFMARLEAIIVDELIIGASAYILLLIFDLIIRFGLGYYVSNMVSMYLVFFILVSIVYPLIMECSKFGNTIGRKISGFEVVEAKEVEENNN
ncbi:RDD family protein [Clostridium cadaveris]|uniref:RDD family protein n=1 Tax=Clostridium cadaveris TaxID=1529 RepID=UPI0015B3ABF6|nr:RDD family protein [Clostridium cadaveris]NWK11961.1 RDD family protein [Clostridium cadaveris]